jgi:hypothetical protein
MRSFGYLYLSWRKGLGHSRHIVGVIKVNSNPTFSYIEHSVIKAKQEGFTPYTEFPDIEKQYNDNVIEIFSQRLIKSERGDIGNFLKFWEIPDNKSDDKLYLMAYTQAWVPTDNFEILADFNPSKNLCFVTDLAGLSKTKIESDQLQVGDVLKFKRVSIESDTQAVQVYKNDLLLGYIKKIHNRAFYKNGSQNFKIKVKSIEKNGVLKRVFLKVSSKD